MPTVVALDRVGGQAIVEDEGRWFRAAVDRGWELVPLEDAADAARCILDGAYEAFELVVDSIQNVPRLVRGQCIEALARDREVSFAAISHLCPPELRRRHGLTELDLGVVAFAARSQTNVQPQYSSERLVADITREARLVSNRREVADISSLLFLSSIAARELDQQAFRPVTDYLRRLVGDVRQLRSRPVAPFGIRELGSLYGSRTIDTLNRATDELRGIESIVFYLCLMGFDVEDAAALLGIERAESSTAWDSAVRKVSVRLTVEI